MKQPWQKSPETERICDGEGQCRPLDSRLGINSLAQVLLAPLRQELFYRAAPRAEIERSVEPVDYFHVVLDAQAVIDGGDNVHP